MKRKRQNSNLAGDLSLFGQRVEGALDCRLLDAELREHVGDALLEKSERERERGEKKEEEQVEKEESNRAKRRRRFFSCSGFSLSFPSFFRRNSPAPGRACWSPGRAGARGRRPVN